MKMRYINIMALGNKEDGEKTLRQLYVGQSGDFVCCGESQYYRRTGYTDDRVIGKTKGFNQKQLRDRLDFLTEEQYGISKCQRDFQKYDQI